MNLLPQPRWGHPFDASRCHYDVSDDARIVEQCPNPAEPGSDLGLCIWHMAAAFREYQKHKRSIDAEFN